jgi:hypothetical protein
MERSSCSRPKEPEEAESTKGPQSHLRVRNCEIAFYQQPPEFALCAAIQPPYYVFTQTCTLFERYLCLQFATDEDNRA